MNRDERASDFQPPPLRALGEDLVHLSPIRRMTSLALPFFWCGAYFTFAEFDCWPAALGAAIALSFVTYGSVSHDLVHRCLGLSRPWNDLFFCLIELLTLRSGHAYRAAHLHHHARFPHEDDVEAVAARRTWIGALADGPVFQFRIWWWAVCQERQAKTWIVAEGAACVLLVGLALTGVVPVFSIYVGLMVMGSWIIPLVTSYLPHDPHAKDVLHQTRVFRGVLLSLIAVEHL